MRPDPSPALPPILRLLWPLSECPIDVAAIDWAAIDRIAGQHRLRPLLLHRLRLQGIEPPEPFAERWTRAMHRTGTAALRHRQEATRLARLLGEDGQRPIILKGAAMAWRGWFRPELRPMRDLDLLLPPAAALAAHARLRAEGFIGEVAVPDLPGKHLPGLISPDGRVSVEIHTALFEALTPMWKAREDALARAAETRLEPLNQPEGLLSFAPTEMLLHVILHGVLDHQFNNGPLFLFDIIELVRHGAIDWPRFWDVAGQCGGVRAALLALRMAQAVDPGIAIDWGNTRPESLSAGTVAQAAAMLVVDIDRLTELGAIGRVMRNRPRDLVRVVWAGLSRMVRRSRQSTPPPAHAQGASFQRLRAALARPEDRRFIGATLGVSRWLREDSAN